MSAGLSIGAVFGRDFRVLRELRAGGMGAVYVVEQLSTGKERALKVMARELVADPSIRERFVLEARAASRIESDHVVEIVTAGVDEESGSPFLVMELLRGEELADAAARIGPLPLGDVVEILEQLGHALERAHAAGIVHRDLKPENLFLAVSKRKEVAFTLKVLDFGIAKLVADGRGGQTGTQPLGTPLFMAPEQTERRGTIRPATDVWALGLIAFRLLTGRDFWFEADGSLGALLRQVVVDPIPPATARAHELGVVATLPAGFDAWFARCVIREVDARFPEAGEAVRAFAALVPPDAPRGVLTAGDGKDDRARRGTGDRSRPTTGVPVSVSAATVAVPAVASTSSGGMSGGAAPGSASSRSLPLLIGAPIVLVGLALVAWKLARPSSPAGETPRASASASVAVAPAPRPSTSVAPAAPQPKGCPAGAVLIAGGKAFLGARNVTDDAKPPHEVTLSPFCLDKTEVTTAAYAACVAQGECERALAEVAWPGISVTEKKRYSAFCNAGHAERDKHPINCVAWEMADHYCKHRGERLPTEAEWEFAARGPTQRNYPWGDELPSATRLNACGKECAPWLAKNGLPVATMYDGDDGYASTAPVGSYPLGASSDGVLDFAGNVWEWTADWYGPYSSEPATNPKGPAQGTARVVRGGGYFGTDAAWERPAYRWKTDPENYNHAIGFRCAADPT